MSEYTGTTTSIGSCQYSNLGGIYQGKRATRDATEQGRYVVPFSCPNGGDLMQSYPPRYDTLTGKENMGPGYFSMYDAYPFARGCGKCAEKYISKRCDQFIVSECAKLGTSEGFSCGAGQMQRTREGFCGSCRN